MASTGHVSNYKNPILMQSAERRALSIVAALIMAGLLLSIFNAPLISSAAGGIEVQRLAVQAPTDPQSALWDDAKEANVPLSSQQIYQPGGGSTRAVRVRAIEDGQTIAIRVSWDDDSKNDATGNMPSDAAAVQLPIDPDSLPYQCMGQANSRVNIWQWKAALEREATENAGTVAFESAGVRNLTSNGICKAVDTPGIEPKLRSYHDGEQWQVVFYRGLGKGDSGSAPLIREKTTSIAFAVWNGERGEARGMKAVSTWNTLTFTTPEASSAGGLLTLGLVIAVSAGVVAWAMRRYGQQ